FETCTVRPKRTASFATRFSRESEDDPVINAVMESARLYSDLAWLWPFVSPPDAYVEEVETFRRRFARHGVPDGASVLHMGSGGGSIDYQLKRYYRVTGFDISPQMVEY